MRAIGVDSLPRVLVVAGFLPAVQEAVYEAVGVRATEFPLSPDRITELLDAKEAAA